MGFSPYSSDEQNNPRLPTIQPGAKWTQSLPAANAQASIAVSGVAGKRLRLTGCSIDNIGSAASSAVQITVKDGAVVVFSTTQVVNAGATLNLTALIGQYGIEVTTAAALTVTVPAGGVNSQWVLNVGRIQY